MRPGSVRSSPGVPAPEDVSCVVPELGRLGSAEGGAVSASSARRGVSTSGTP